MTLENEIEAEFPGAWDSVSNECECGLPDNIDDRCLDHGGEERTALRAEIERLRADVDMWHRHYASLLNDAHDENERLRARIEYFETCGDCGEARADIPRCTVCVVEYVPRQARLLSQS